jgi:vitamin B12 transporter
MSFSSAVLRAPFAPAATVLASALACSAPAFSQDTTVAALSPVVVTATRTPTPLDRVVADVVVIDEEQLRDAVGSTAEDLLRERAGLQILRNGGPGQSVGFFVRGMSTNSTVVLIDGVRVGSATLGQAQLESLSVAQIERIEVLRGPGSSLYGADAMGGVIQIFTRRGASGAVRVHGTVAVGRYDSNEASGGVSGALGGFDYALSLSREASDGISAIAAPGDTFGNYNPDADGFRRRGGSAQLGYTPVEGHRVGVRWAESRLDSQYDGAEFLPPTFMADASPDFRNKLDTRVVALDYAARFTKSWHSDLTLAQNDDRLLTGGTQISRFETERRQLSWQNALTLAQGHNLVGLLERIEETVASDSFAPRERERNNNALVLSYTGESEPHRWQADVRQDRNSAYGNHTTAKLGYALQFTRPWSVRASAGTAFRAPSFNELYFPGYGVPSLEPEKSRSVELGTAWREDTWSVEASLYRNRVRDLIGYEPDRSFCPPDPSYDFGCARNVNRARLKGGSLLARGVAADVWHWSAGVEVLDATNAEDGTRLLRRAAHTASGSLAYRTQRWGARAAVQGVGKRPDMGGTLPSYELLDLSAYYVPARHWRVETKLFNALDKRYEPVKDYGAPGRALWLVLSYDSQAF